MTDTQPTESDGAPRGALTFDRHCAEILAQTTQLTAAVHSADLRAPVPSCPGWVLGQLLRHVGGGHRWAATIVRTRADRPPPDDELRDLSGSVVTDPAPVAPWLSAGAEQLVDALRAAGPDAAVWTPVPRGGTAFLARRFAHETLVHRADAVSALGAEFAVDQAVALDAVDEWLKLETLPQQLDVRPARRTVLGRGATIGLHATDVGSGGGWLVDLTGDVVIWRHADRPTTATMSGPLTAVLLAVYRRRPIGHGVQAGGDVGLLDAWLEQAAFG